MKRFSARTQTTTRAKEYVRNKRETQGLLNRAIRKAVKNRIALNRIWDDLIDLFHLISAWVSGRYKQVPWKTVLLSVGALLYLVDPLDIIPDFIPLSGLIDDATIIGFVIHSIRKDIRDFKAWEQRIHEYSLQKHAQAH